MAGPDARPDIWRDAMGARIAAAQLGPRAEEIGRIEQIGDGIAQVSGLPGLRLDELVSFGQDRFGFVHALDPDVASCVLLDRFEDLKAGAAVLGTGDVVRVPVGPELLGRIVDPLGRPLDGAGPIAASARAPIERPAPSIIDRDLVTEPVHTGRLVIDALLPLGRGQRELIIGDRATGKTTLAVDALVAQKQTDMVCIYVAIGQKTASVAQVLDTLRRHGNFARCIAVMAEASTAPGLQWIAPFSAFTIAEHFRDTGEHALVVLDDLSKHAATHREIALLTRQPPGREAYPGDVFYLHARLLERAAKLSAARGGGSLTALVVAETDAGNLSAYIPTNLISITDGQIVLDGRLFQEGVKPAVDVGRSVSRVGGKTQPAALREAAQSLRLDYAQFLELELFTRFSGVPDQRVRDRLARGARIRAALVQPQFEPMRLVDEVALLLALQGALIDGLPVERLVEIRRLLPDRIDVGAPDVAQNLEAAGMLGAEGRGRFIEIMRALVAELAARPNADGVLA